MKREQVVSYFFVAVFLFIIYQLILMFSPFFKAVFWAAVLAYIFHPLYAKLQKPIGLKPTAAALITTVFVFLVVILPAIFMVISVMKEIIIDLYQKISFYHSNDGLKTVLDRLRQILAPYNHYDFGVRWESMQQDLSNVLLGWAQKTARFAASQFALISKNVLLWLLNFLFTTLFLFFFLRNGGAYYNFFYRIVPMTTKNKDHVSKQINDTFSAVIRGQLLISILQATLTGIMLWLFHFPLPFFFGFLAFLTSMLPTGVATVWVPTVIYCFLLSDFQRGTWLIVCGLLISTVDNVLKPVLIGEKTKLPVLLLFLGLLGGLRLYGFTGIFLGPIMLSLFFALLKIYREEYLDEA